MPKGLAKSNSNLAGATANPVIEGLTTKKIIMKINETALAMNNGVFIYSFT